MGKHEKTFRCFYVILFINADKNTSLKSYYGSFGNKEDKFLGRSLGKTDEVGKDQVFSETLK